MFDRRSSVEQTGHMLTYGTIMPGSLVDLNSWTKLYPTRRGIGGGVIAQNSCWDQARGGGVVLHGDAKPGVGNLGSGFSSSLWKVAMCSLPEAVRDVWRVISCKM